MKHVTLELAISTLKGEIMGNETYVYEKDQNGYCFYVKDGQPSCLIGRALHRLGVGINLLSEYDVAQDGGTDAWSVCRGLQQRGIMTFDDIVPGLFRTVQVRQDEGRPWGEVVEWSIGAMDL